MPIRRQFLLLALVVAITLIYFFLNQPIGAVHSTKTFLDDSIKLVPAFIVPYLVFLPFFWLTVVYADVKNKFFVPLALTIMTTYLISYFFFIFFQTHIDRPVIQSTDMFSRLLTWVYAHDRPYNAFPSLHSASAIILARYYQTIQSRYARATWIFALVVILSTVFTYQHYVADAAAGILLGFVISRWLLRASS